jgi:zinc and cadmium transporter
MNLEIFIAGVLVMLMSLVGVFTTHTIARQFIEARLSFLVSFSAGVFMVTAGMLALEVFHVMSGLWFPVGMITVGYVLAFALQSLWPETHHHHDEACARDVAGARRLLVGDGVHNIADGIVLATAFAAAPVVGVAATVSIMIHEALQELSEFFVLRQAGYSVKKALLVNFAVSGTILIGIAVGYFALSTEGLEGVLLAVSAGFFIHVVFHDLLPKPHEHETIGVFLRHLGLVMIGALLMGLINVTLSDEHAHGDVHGSDLGGSQLLPGA